MTNQPLDPSKMKFISVIIDPNTQTGGNIKHENVIHNTYQYVDYFNAEIQNTVHNCGCCSFCNLWICSCISLCLFYSIHYIYYFYLFLAGLDSLNSTIYMDRLVINISLEHLWSQIPLTVNLFLFMLVLMFTCYNLYACCGFDFTRNKNALFIK
eukprot:171198_1